MHINENISTGSIQILEIEDVSIKPYKLQEFPLHHIVIKTAAVFP